MSYTPHTNPQEYSTEINISGQSPRKIVKEENKRQGQVAENQDWLLARYTNSYRTEDSQSKLEELGFTVEKVHNGLFYKVIPPSGWTKSTTGYWTDIKNSNGDLKLMMFYKAADYDTEAFLSFKE